MTQSLVINGKEYIPTNVLSLRFNYSADYIGKLAREEKVLGTLIGRQWFVEPESLNFFLQKAEIEKKLRKEELRRQRKLEHSAHQQQLRKKEMVSRADELVAVCLTLVVLLCGGLVGGLGWIVSSENLGFAELEAGMSQSVAFVGGALFPHVETEMPVTQHIEVGVPTPETREVPLVFTTLPEFPELQPIGSSTPEVEDSFSDEVRVVSSAEGEVIVPVFREGDGLQQFLLVPINANDE